MLTRPIPKTGEPVPVIGLGTWATFDVAPADRQPLLEVLRRFLDGGGRVIDSSPMYGRAEETVGALVAALGSPHRPFLATKVWTRGRAEGVAQMERSLQRFGVATIDLMQVHNLVDWRVHLPVLREWKQAGRIRHIGVTHYLPSAFDELEQILRTEAIDFVQLPYSVGIRAAEQRLLPAAQETGTAVLVMRPLEEGGLIARLRRRPLPSWAAAFGCSTWAQLCLKFVLAHPAVTAPIPATANPAHMIENLAAGEPPLPDDEGRRRIIAAVEG